MTETHQNFTIWTDNDVQIVVTVSDEDITNYGLEMNLYEYQGADSPLLTKTDGDAGTQIKDADTAIISINDTDLDGIDVGGSDRYYYRIDLTDISGKDSTVTTGQITINE